MLKILLQKCYIVKIIHISHKFRHLGCRLFYFLFTKLQHCCCKNVHEGCDFIMFVLSDTAINRYADFTEYRFYCCYLVTNLQQR